MHLPGYLLSLPVVLSVLAWMSAVVSLNELRAGPRFRRGREGLKGACSDGKVSHMSKLALFPRCFHLLQSLITCSMQMLRGEGLGGLVMCGDIRLDTWAVVVVPDEES